MEGLSRPQSFREAGQEEMAEAGDPQKLSNEHRDTTENMDFNATDGLVGVFNSASSEENADINLENTNLMEVEGNSAGDVVAEPAKEIKWEASIDEHQAEAAIGDAENFDQPMESDPLQQLQQEDEDAHDPADLGLLTFIDPNLLVQDRSQGTTHEEAGEGFLGASLQPNASALSDVADSTLQGDLQLEKECIRIKVVSQRQEKTIAVYSDYNVLQLKSIVEAKFQVGMDQIVLIKDCKILADDEVLGDLDIHDDSVVLLAIRYYPQSEQHIDGVNLAHFWPGQYTRLALPNFDLGELQEQMQKQFSENPELVREAMMNPRVQDLMANPAKVKEMMLACPGGQKLLEKRPDIAEALNDPKIMEESLRIAQDQGLLEETLSKMEAARDPNRIPTMTTVPPQEIPTAETMMKMTCQDPEMLGKMFASPSYKAMIEGMVANPSWTEKILTNNPMLAANPQMRNQIKSFLPMFLNQLQDPEYVAMISNPKALKSMLKVQQGICNLQSEAPNLTTSMGFPNFSAPGTFNIQVEGDTDHEEPIRPVKGEADPLSIMMTQMVRQTKEGIIDKPLEERYAKDLDFMEQMGFVDRETNLALLTATFGDVNAAVSQLLL